jgi:hypothetical protein
MDYTDNQMAAKMQHLQEQAYTQQACNTAYDQPEGQLETLLHRIQQANAEGCMLKASMRPDPEYQERRLAQFTPERRARYFRAVGGL